MQRLTGFLRAILFTVLGLISWGTWSLANAIGVPRLLRGQASKRHAPTVPIDQVYTDNPPRLPTKVANVADQCEALRWSDETIRTLTDQSVNLNHPMDREMRAMFPISVAWQDTLVTVPDVAWESAIERVFQPTDDAPLARFVIRPPKSKSAASDPERPWCDLPEQPTGWYRSLWFQGCRAVTPFHYDTRHATLTMLRGRKRFLLFPPFRGWAELQPFAVLSRKGCFASRIGHENPKDPRELNFLSAAPSAYLEIVLQPGETIYIPPYWWHHVECLDNSITLQHFRPLRPAERLHPLMTRVYVEMFLNSLLPRVD